LQCVAMCCNVLQCVAPHRPLKDASFIVAHATKEAVLCCSVLQCVAACCSVLERVAVCCSMLQCVAMYYSVLQCATVCCSVLQCVASHRPRKDVSHSRIADKYIKKKVIILAQTTKEAVLCCSVLQCVTMCCSVLQCAAVCCSVLQRVAPHRPYKDVSHSRIADKYIKKQDYHTRAGDKRGCLARAVCCSVLQCVAVCCSVLQCVAMCCSVLQCVAPDLRKTSLIVAQTTKEAVLLVLAYQKFSILSSPFISLVYSAASGLFNHYFLVACKRLPCSCSPRVKLSQKSALPLFSSDVSAASRLVRIFDLPDRGAISTNPHRNSQKVAIC